MAARSRNSSIQRACTLATDLKASNHIDLLPPWLAWCTRRARRIQFPHKRAHTHRLSNVSSRVCMTKTALLLPCQLPPQVLFPRVSPPQTFFPSKFKFLFKNKKYPPTKHTYPCAKTKPSQVFSNTAIKAVPCRNGTSIDNAIHTLQNTDFYIILSSKCTVSASGTWPRDLFARKQKVYTMYVTFISDKTQKVQVWTLQFYGQMKR